MFALAALIRTLTRTPPATARTRLHEGRSPRAVVYPAPRAHGVPCGRRVGIDVEAGEQRSNMLPRRVKAAYYVAAGPVMRLNAFLYRNLRAPRNGTVRAHLGPGQRNYLEGWINVDANRFTARCDVWADLRNKLPFRTNTVDAVYSHHMIEHLPDELLEFHFREVFRCLRPGGAFRIGGPNADSATQKFLEGDRASTATACSTGARRPATT